MGQFDFQSKTLVGCYRPSKVEYHFLVGLSLHFTLKPPYSIRYGKLRLTIWTLPFLDFFGQIWTQRTLRHILGPTLVIFEICHFLAIPGSFEYFSENGCALRKSVFSMKEWIITPLSVVLGGEVPRLNHGPI